ncbi:hypothetical protein D3C76_1459450 [compost metagenome]
MEHVHRLEKILVELRLQQLVVGNVAGEGHHFTVGQVDEWVEGKEMLVIGGGGFARTAGGVDHQAVDVGAGRAQDEGDVFAVQLQVELVEEGDPGNVLHWPLVEVTEQVAERL